MTEDPVPELMGHHSNRKEDHERNKDVGHALGAQDTDTRPGERVRGALSRGASGEPSGRDREGRGRYRVTGSDSSPGKGPGVEDSGLSRKWDESSGRGRARFRCGWRSRLESGDLG